MLYDVIDDVTILRHTHYVRSSAMRERVCEGMGAGNLLRHLTFAAALIASVMLASSARASLTLEIALDGFAPGGGVGSPGKTLSLIHI